MTTTTKGTKSLARKIALACFPGYRGRKIRVESRESYTMADYWDGGTRRTAVAYDLTGAAEFPCRRANEFARNPMNGAAHATFAIPAGVAIVERAYFCGKDAGITIYVSPAADKAGLLAEAVVGPRPRPHLGDQAGGHAAGGGLGAPAVKKTDEPSEPTVEGNDRLDPDKFYVVGLNVVEHDTRTGKNRVLPPAEEVAFRAWMLPQRSKS